MEYLYQRFISQVYGVTMSNKQNTDTELRGRFYKEFDKDIKIICDSGCIALGSLLKFIEKEKQNSFREGQQAATELERAIRMNWKSGNNRYTLQDLKDACLDERKKTISRIVKWANGALETTYPIRYIIAGLEMMEKEEKDRTFGL